MIVVRCKECGKEITGQSGKTLACGCPNMMTVNEDSVTAVDLTRTIMVSSNNDNTKEGLTSQDLQWQEQRRKRKIRKMDFEIR